MAILALDIGLKRVGAAINPYGAMVLELPTITFETHLQLFSKIKAVIEEYGIEAIVLGRPRDPSSAVGQLVEEVKDYFGHLKIILVDETLTTKEAERLLAQEGGGDSDARAARLILEQYISSKQ